MAKYQIISWHTIPLGVKATGDDGTARENLEERFQQVVDAVAMRTGLTDDESYSEGFRWSPAIERPGTAKEVAAAVAAELTAEYTNERLNQVRHELEKSLAKQ